MCSRWGWGWDCECRLGSEGWLRGMALGIEPESELLRWGGGALEAVKELTPTGGVRGDEENELFLSSSRASCSDGSDCRPGSSPEVRREPGGVRIPLLCCCDDGGGGGGACE